MENKPQVTPINIAQQIGGAGVNTEPRVNTDAASTKPQATKVDVPEEQQIPLVLDFIVLTFLWIIAINLGFIVIYKAVSFALVLANAPHADWMTNLIDLMNRNYGVAQRFVGIGGIFLALALTFLKLRYRIFKIPMPPKAITTHDVPVSDDAVSVQQRTVEGLDLVIRLLGLGLAIMISLDLLGMLTGSSESVAPALILLAICVGVPLVVLLIVLSALLKKKNGMIK